MMQYKFETEDTDLAVLITQTISDYEDRESVVPDERSVRLKTLRQRVNMTQRELAEESGVSYVTISRIENGIHRGQSTTYNSLMSVLNKRFEDEFGYSNDRND